MFLHFIHFSKNFLSNKRFAVVALAREAGKSLYFSVSYFYKPDNIS